MLFNIFDTVPERPVGNTDNLYFVLDGSSLIHRVVWPKQETFGDVYTTYMSYIKRHYGDEVTVVFDRYTESSVNTNCSISVNTCKISLRFLITLNQLTLRLKEQERDSSSHCTATRRKRKVV
ncbi:hypothetical protein AVEN_27997-1 [Araneus ventricosus]|uniref:Uncharacterized protein n=1 Tax=Araneus ventricosus TaxID=182803 RepID=A0A4Y2BF49_ARAVE|nr:hypothetical protein AVEN_27997-1 [Araneus ventricosus]